MTDKANENFAEDDGMLEDEALLKEVSGGVFGLDTASIDYFDANGRRADLHGAGIGGGHVASGVLAQR